MNPTHRLSPFITLGGLDDHGKETLKYQRENPHVKEKREIPRAWRGNSKDLDELYTSERHDCEGMTVTHYQCLLCAYNTSGVKGKWPMRRHVSNVHRHERVSCGLCGKSLKNSKTLEIHLIMCHIKHGNSLSCQNNPLSTLQPVSKEVVIGDGDDREKINSMIGENTSVSLTRTILTENETLAPMTTDATLVKQEADRKRKLSKQVSIPTNAAVEEKEEEKAMRNIEEKAKRKAEKKAKKKAKVDAGGPPPPP